MAIRGRGHWWPSAREAISGHQRERSLVAIRGRGQAMRAHRTHLDGTQMRDAIRCNQGQSREFCTWMVPGKRFAAPTERHRSPIARSRTCGEGWDAVMSTCMLEPDRAKPYRSRRRCAPVNRVALRGGCWLRTRARRLGPEHERKKAVDEAGLIQTCFLALPESSVCNPLDACS